MLILQIARKDDLHKNNPPKTYNNLFSSSIIRAVPEFTARLKKLSRTRKQKGQKSHLETPPKG